MFLPLNSEASVLVIPSTTKKCHTILTNGTNNNHSMPGSRVLEATEHLFKALVSVRTYIIVGSRSRQATNRRTIKCHGCRKSAMNNSLQQVYRRRSNYISEANG
jgi:arginase family enzyme